MNFGCLLRRRWASLAWGSVMVPMLLGLRLLADQLTGGSFMLVGAPAAGGTSTGSTFRLTGWIANAGAGTSTGSTYDLTCGVLGVYVVTDGDVVLKVEFTADGKARLWWPAEVEGYRLIFTTGLTPDAPWEDVDPAPVGNAYVTDPVQPARFFRLVKP